MLPLEKCRRTYHDDAKSETAESSISDSDLDNIVGIADGSELQVHSSKPPFWVYGILMFRAQVSLLFYGYIGIW